VPWHGTYSVAHFKEDEKTNSLAGEEAADGERASHRTHLEDE
jgi:hypothetical protein